MADSPVGFEPHEAHVSDAAAGAAKTPVPHTDSPEVKELEDVFDGIKKGDRPDLPAVKDPNFHENALAHVLAMRDVVAPRRSERALTELTLAQKQLDAYRAANKGMFGEANKAQSDKLEYQIAITRAIVESGATGIRARFEAAMGGIRTFLGGENKVIPLSHKEFMQLLGATHATLITPSDRDAMESAADQLLKSYRAKRYGDNTKANATMLAETISSLKFNGELKQEPPVARTKLFTKGYEHARWLRYLRHANTHPDLYSATDVRVPGDLHVAEPAKVQEMVDLTQAVLMHHSQFNESDVFGQAQRLFGALDFYKSQIGAAGEPVFIQTKLDERDLGYILGLQATDFCQRLTKERLHGELAAFQAFAGNASVSDQSHKNAEALRKMLSAVIYRAGKEYDPAHRR